LEEIERKNEVLHIHDEISTEFEISAVIRELSNGPAVIFENVEGYNVRIIANVCGTRDRISAALKTSREGLYAKISEALKSPVQPEIVDYGPVMEVREKPDLHRIPILLHFERDAGPYITAAAVSARGDNGRVENLSVHRLLVLDENHLAIRLVPRHLYKLWSMAREEGRDLDVAISIGLHPAVLLAAASSPPFGVSEYAVANNLLDGRLKLIRCMEVDAYAPAEAELVIEGRISCDKMADEGPFVDITGTYDIRRKQPIVEVVNIMHRRDYIYQAILPGGPEHRLLWACPAKPRFMRLSLKSFRKLRP